MSLVQLDRLDSLDTIRIRRLTLAGAIPARTTRHPTRQGLIYNRICQLNQLSKHLMTF